jgi:hypothetical protein
MAGGTPEHARLAAAIGTTLTNQLAGKRSAVFSEALRVRSKATGFAGLEGERDGSHPPGLLIYARRASR